MGKEYYVYIMTNPSNKVLYVGITNDLVRRAYEHRNKLVHGFTAKYNVSKIVYFENTINVSAAIEREKQLKGGSRKKKIDLVTMTNPNWDDLYNSLV